MARHWYNNIESLRRNGFEGFITIRDLRDCKLRSVPGNRGDMGVYVVVRNERNTPVFLKQSTAGRFKGRDPNVSLEKLQEHWIPDSPIVYIGKAATLRFRLKQYLAFGAGRAIGHWGGRLIWHLPKSENLLVCWKKTLDEIPREVERRMIGEFVSAFGVRPFANLCD